MLFRSNLVSIFISLFQISFAQVYHSFPDSSAKWSEASFIYGATSGNNSYDNYSGRFYALGNDTIIDSVPYTLVGYQPTWAFQFYNYELSYAYNSSLNPPGQIFGAIREDSSKKVWYRNFFANFYTSNIWCIPCTLPADTEILLYDFDLQVGDSLSWAIHINNEPKRVISIDSIQFNDGSYRKRYLLQIANTLGDDYWIEGMGSTSGLFGAYLLPGSTQHWNYICWLNCFWENGEYQLDISKPPLGVSCDSTLYVFGIDTPILDEPEIDYYPNPVTDLLNLVFKDERTRKIQVVNVIGELQVETISLQNSFVLNISSLSKGIYFVIITNEANDRTIHKVIKM